MHISWWPSSRMQQVWKSSCRSLPFLAGLIIGHPPPRTSCKSNPALSSSSSLNSGSMQQKHLMAAWRLQQYRQSCKLHRLPNLYLCFARNLCLRGFRSVSVVDQLLRLRLGCIRHCCLEFLRASVPHAPFKPLQSLSWDSSLRYKDFLHRRCFSWTSVCHGRQRVHQFDFTAHQFLLLVRIAVVGSRVLDSTVRGVVRLHCAPSFFLSVLLLNENKTLW